MSNKVTSPVTADPPSHWCIARFGRSLHVFHQQLEQERGRNPANTQMLQVRETVRQEGSSQVFTILSRQDAFSLLAYPDPWNSSVGGQLDPAGREPVCAQLNSAILGKCLDPRAEGVAIFHLSCSESKNLPGRPPLEVSVAHTSQLLQLMSHNDLGACAFTNMESLLN